MRKQRSAPVPKTPAQHWAWTAVFLCLLLANTVFSYSDLPLLWKLETGLFLFVIPLALLWYLKTPSLSETGPLIPNWLWACLLALSLLPRVWRLASLSSWPVADEGMFGYFATLLEQRWDWKLVHSPANNPAPYGWLSSAFFQLFGHSLATLWLVPALMAWGCLLFLPFLNRKIIPGPTAFIMGCWLAFGFWPLYLERFFHQSVFLVFWECLVLAVLLRCLDSPPGGSYLGGRWIFLAVLTGLGFYTYLGWPLVALLVFLVFLSRPIQPWRRKTLLALQFGLWILLPATPLVLSFSRNYHFYFQHLWTFGTPEGLGERLQLPWAYWRALFWGSGAPGSFGYGPLWGGLMNPIQSSLFFLGLAALGRPPFQPKNLWIFAGLLVFFIPAFTTNTYEMMRLAALIPLLAYVSAIGTIRLLSPLSTFKKALVFFLVLGGSFVLDSRHLFQVYPDYPKLNPGYYGMHKSPEYEEAFSLLRARSQKDGPGLLLLNAVPDPFDQTLFVASYSFNAAANPRLDAPSASWAGVLANIHEEPYLLKSFPGTEWRWLSEGFQRRDGGLMLALIPLDPASRERIGAWARADRALQELTTSVMELGVDPDQSQMLGILERAYPLFKGDRLLESRYWRLWAVHEMAGGDLGQAIEGEKKAVSRGYPMAELFNELGGFLYKDGRLAEAKKAFGQALRLKPNCTDAALNLQNLSLVQKPATPKP